MDTKSTKTVIIALLIIANIFFVYNIANIKLGSENIPSDMIDDAVSVLNSRGFVVEKDKIPVKKPANVIYEGVYEGLYSDGIFDEIVKDFSGISDEEFKETDYMQMPSGIYCAAGNYQFIFSSMDFSSTDFFRLVIIEQSYLDFVRDLEEDTEMEAERLAEKGVAGIQKADIKNTEKIISSFIKKYQAQDVRLGFEIIGFDENKSKNCDCVLIIQTVDGLPVDSHTAYIEIHEGEVKFFSGEWYFGEFIARHGMPLLDSVNILFKCMQIDRTIAQENETLKKMDMQYNVIFHDADISSVKFYLAPSWRLEFESGKKLSYNMITGDKNQNNF